ncbi:MAG: hypothetical protein Kow0068_22580 [Marinilabiliales bacterium]
MEKEKKNIIRGIIGTALFHIILLVIFLLVGFTPAPVEFPDDIGGILIDFGDADNGIGNVEPENTQNTANPVTANQNNDNQEEFITQDFQETATVEQHNNTSQNTNQNTTEENTEDDEQPELNPDALFHGNNNVSSEGNTNSNGNMGNPDGANTNNYKGGTGSGGISYKLDGRSPVGEFPKPEYPSGNVSGKVVVNIKVDKHGKVISVSVGKGTTATDERLITNAKKAAWKVRFNEDFSTIEQVGTITYNFSLQ